MSFARIFFPLWLLVMATYCEARQYETAQLTFCVAAR